MDVRKGRQHELDSLAPFLRTDTHAPADDSRSPEQRQTDHERLRQRGAMLAARTGQDQSVPPFPPQGYPGDCGLDLMISEELRIRPGESANVPCGVTVALPPGTFGWITGRSSTWSKWGLWVMPGIIDEGWRGELRTLVHRPVLDHRGDGSERLPYDLVIEAGTRLAQIVVLPNLLSQVRVYRVLPDDLPSHERGEQGFGSTG